MALNPHVSDPAANAAANAVAALLNNGYLRIYSGTQPASANDPLSGNTQLASLVFSATAFASASGGIVTANSITSDPSTVAGTATWFRCYNSNGTTAVIDGSVGTSGADLNLNSVTITAGATMAITAFAYTVME
jgi:hypothetical protein